MIPWIIYLTIFFAEFKIMLIKNLGEYKKCFVSPHNISVSLQPNGEIRIFLREAKINHLLNKMSID